MDDAARLRRRLKPVEAEARGQPWSQERPWRVDTHVWMEGRVAVVDLHDLKVRLARRVLDGVGEDAPDLQGGAVILVIGQGRHSLGPGALGGAIQGDLRARCASRPWRWSPGAAGRLVWVLDPSRAPAHLTGRLGLGTRLLIASLFLAAALACLGPAVARLLRAP